ncbi:MAG: aldolase/citrate lyase family protein [Acidobacteriota bacterium]
MKASLPLLVLLFVVTSTSGQLADQSAAPPSPARINRAIDLLAQGQPVYYATGRGGYDEGKAMAQTASDYINYELEHGAFDMSALRAFMRGLVDGGPTKSGHRTPAVIATLPVLGLDEAGVRANHWVVQQVLAAGVHGILLCHARVPEAARAIIEASRYPFAPKIEGLAQGLRGSGSQGFAAQIWGIPANDYLRRADAWPLNPEGELLFGVKIEDSHALTNAERTTKVPGVAFAEWGPGDMGFWLVGRPGTGPATDGYPPVMLQARARVLKATKDAKILFLNSCDERNVVEMIKEGVMICTGGYEAGRKFTKRQMPW